jgi:hypothetical protein
MTAAFQAGHWTQSLLLVRSTPQSCHRSLLRLSQSFGVRRSGAIDPLRTFEIRQAMTAMQGLLFLVLDAENVSILHDGSAPVG